MNNKEPKYLTGDILQLNADELFKIKIVYVCRPFYNNTGCNIEIHYYTKHIGNDECAPLCINESLIDKYYKKVLN